MPLVGQLPGCTCARKGGRDNLLSEMSFQPTVKVRCGVLELEATVKAGSGLTLSPLKNTNRERCYRYHYGRLKSHTSCQVIRLKCACRMRPPCPPPPRIIPLAPTRKSLPMAGFELGFPGSPHSLDGEVQGTKPHLALLKHTSVLRRCCSGPVGRGGCTPAGW